MKYLLEIAMLGLAGSACLLMLYWGWQEFVLLWTGRRDRRPGRETTRWPWLG